MQNFAVVTFLQGISSINIVSVVLIVIAIGSIVQGIRKGASGSAKHLFYVLIEAAITVAAVLAAWRISAGCSVYVQSWLTGLSLELPNEQVNKVQQAYYTLMTSIRDFPLLRFGILFLLTYGAVKAILSGCLSLLMARNGKPLDGERQRSTAVSATAGGIIGAALGIGRSLLVIAALFIYVTLFPHTGLASYITASSAYQKGATEVVAPLTGEYIATKLPVFTRAVEAELSGIMQRKYDVVDHYIPDDIALAAQTIVQDAQSEEQRARLLYDWVGTRIQYDDHKVEQYVQYNEWLEQTPEQTFTTRLGVCIDYARLYALMARSVGLQVKVITGLGYNGHGGYGPHAWNEIFLPQSNEWVPLDPTWAQAGDWFNPPQFYDTHIKDKPLEA